MSNSRRNLLTGQWFYQNRLYGAVSKVFLKITKYQKLLKLPKYVKPIGIIASGYPKETKPVEKFEMIRNLSRT